MPLARFLPLVTLFAVLSGADAPPADDPAARFAPWLERAIAAGMPDVRGATFWRGTWAREPEAGRPPVFLLGFHHLHLRLQDGRWLMRGIHLRPPGEPATMMKPGFSLIDPRAPGMVTRTSWGQLDNELLDCSHWMPSAALRHLLGFAGLVQAEQPGLSGNGAMYWDENWTRVQGLRLPGNPREPEEWSEPDPLGAPPGTSERRLLQHLLIAQAMHAGTADGVKAFSAAALALVSDDERAVRHEAVARLAELPAEDDAPPAAPTVERLLQEWNNLLYAHQVHDGGKAEEHDLHQARIPWTAAHIDALVDLAGDTRPSRWLDATMPRTIGENALRALGWRWGVDPRLLVGRDPAAPWSVAEQRATALALQTLWKPWRGRSLAEAVAAEHSLGHLLWTTRMTVALEPSDRPAAARAVVTAWRALDQAGRDALPVDAAEDVLGLLGDDAQLDALVRSWPVSGTLRRTLALWHELRGDPAPLTSHLRDALAGTLTDQQDVYAVSCVTALGPDQERLDLLLAALREEPSSPTFQYAHGIRSFSRRGAGNGSPLIVHRFGGFYGRTTMVSALVLTGLWDERPLRDAPALRGHAIDHPRVCDDVASARADEELSGLLSLDHKRHEAFDLSLPVADRDAVLARARAALRPQVAGQLAASGLRMPDPAGGGDLTPIFPAWWQAELDAASAEGKAVALLLTNTRTCAPCVALEREVLSQPAWRTWADQHLRLVVLDGGQHADEPEYWRRMNEMAQLYDGAGTPSFFLIANTGRRLSRCYDHEPGGPVLYIAEFERALAAGR